SVVATFLYMFRGSVEIHPDTWRTPTYLLAAGIAYIVGYVAQDVASISRVVTTAPVQQPWRVMQSVYLRFKQTKWKPVGDIDTLYKRQAEWERESAKGNAPDYERTILLMQVGTSGGPCALVCAVLLIVKLCFFEHDVLVDTALLVGAV